MGKALMKIFTYRQSDRQFTNIKMMTKNRMFGFYPYDWSHAMRVPGRVRVAGPFIMWKKSFR